MARPAKTLEQHVRDGSFEKRKHQELLDLDDLVSVRELRALQRRYRRLKTKKARDEAALEFERLARAAAPERQEQAQLELEQELARLGPAKSAGRTIGFFPRFLSWDDGSPFDLDHFQKQIIREVKRRDSRDRRIYKEILLGLTRGSGKTPLASGLMLEEECSSELRFRGFQIAGSKEQAALGTEYAGNWVDDGDLSEWLSRRAREIKLRDGRGSYTVLSSDGRLGHGRKPNYAIADELWLFRTAAEVQAYVALQTALHKIQDAQLIAISTAGYSKGSLLGQIYDRALQLPDVETHRDGFLTIARDLESGFLMWWYGMPDGYELDLDNRAAVLRALKLANPGSWVDHEEMLRALYRPGTDRLEWLRLYLNAWTKVKGSWLPAGGWDGCVDEQLEIPEAADIYVAVDAAHSYDTTAVGWAWRAPDGRIVVRSHSWSCRENVPADVHVSGGELDNEELVEPFIHQLADRYKVREVVADPNYFATELRHLSRRFLTAPQFPQSNEQVEAVQEFYRAVLAKRVVHQGKRTVSGRLLAAHVDAIEGKKNAAGYWKIGKLVQSNPIDAAMAVLIAHGRALLAPKPSVYNTRGLRFLDDEEPEVDQDDDDMLSEAELARRMRQRGR